MSFKNLASTKNCDIELFENYIKRDHYVSPGISSVGAIGNRLVLTHEHQHTANEMSWNIGTIQNTLFTWQV